MRIRFLSDQIYESAPGKGPKFAKGFVLDEADVGKALSLSDEPTAEWTRGFLHRWVQRGVAEQVDGRAPAHDPGEVTEATEPVKTGDEQAEETDYSQMTRRELDALAEQRDVDITAARNKADVIAALERADKGDD